MSLPLNDNLISVQQAAERLGVSPRRVQALLERGELPGLKAGGNWFVDRLSVRRRGVGSRLRGRPFSPTGAWAFLALLAQQDGDARGSIQMPGVQRSMLSRLRDRLASEGLVEVAPLLAKRATVHRYWVQPSQIPRIAQEEKLVLSGVSASDRYDLEILPADELEGYVLQADLAQLVERYALAEFVRKPNLILHAVPFWPFAPGMKVAPLPVVLLDMAESEDARTLAVGREGLARYSAEHHLPVDAAPSQDGTE